MNIRLDVLALIVLGLPAACGGSESTGGTFATPYAPGSATVIGNGTTSACGDATCIQAGAQCGKDGAADVVVSGTGDIAGVVCYGQDVTVATVPTDSVPEYTTDGNNTVLVLDGKDGGFDVVGDLTISGNNAIVYGSSPGTSVIGGTVDVQKNNAKIRGVTIEGDVTIDKNNTTLVYCVIKGNLTISGNNTTIAGCDVYGKVTISGVNTSMLGDRINGVDSLSGQNLTCKDDVRFDDANGNGVVEATEVGAAIQCG